MRFQGSGLKAWELGIQSQCLGFLWGLGIRVQGLGFLGLRILLLRVIRKWAQDWV